MSEHEHAWRLALHLDGCHAYSSSYACACGACLLERGERDPSFDPFTHAWLDEDCPRCSELVAGAKPKFSSEVVLP